MICKRIFFFLLSSLALADSFPDSERVLKYVLTGQEIIFVPPIFGQPQVMRWTRGDGRGVAFLDELGELEFPEYKNRITLDSNTAELTIKTATHEDGGNYDLKLKMNNKDLRFKYRVEVIEKVTKPNITCVMSGEHQATLVCSTDSKHPHLLEWDSHGNKQPGPNLTINLAGEFDDRVYRCDVSNPLTKQTATFAASKCFMDKPSDGEHDINLSKRAKQIVINIIATIIIIITAFPIAFFVMRKKCQAQNEDMDSPGSCDKLQKVELSVEMKRTISDLPCQRTFTFI
ncbi:CD48 antigen-like [Festucalex cinctus]